MTKHGVRSLHEVAFATFLLAGVAVGVADRALAVPCTTVNIARDYCPGVTSNQSCTNVSPTGNPPTCSGGHTVIQLGDFGSEYDDEYWAYIRPSGVQVPCTLTFPCKVRQDSMGCEDSLNPDPVLTTNKGSYKLIDCNP